MKKKYYFAKLNVSENIFSQDRDEIINTYIPNAILTNTQIKNKREWQFNFTDTQSIVFEGKKYIKGNLTKGRKFKKLIVDGDSTKQKSYNDLEATTAEFFYDVTTEIIAFRTPSKFDHETFFYYFKELIMMQDVRIGDIKVIMYTKKNSIREQIKLIEVVTEIDFYLIKPNPGKKEFLDFEDIIDDHNLKELDLKMKNEQGIKYTDENDPSKFSKYIESGLSLVDSAYGTVEVEGYNETIKKEPGKKPKTIKKIVKATSAKYKRFINIQETNVRDIIKKISEEIDKILG